MPVSFTTTYSSGEVILDATWGGSAANVYATMAFVNTFLTTHVFDNAAWIALTGGQKRAAVLEATRDIDSLNYLGCRYYADQSLEFPRELALDFPYNRVGSQSTWSEMHIRMERDVQEAMSYQALHISRNAGRNYHAENQAQGIRSYSESVGPISESYVYGAASASRLCQEALAKLAPWRESKKVFRG